MAARSFLMCSGLAMAPRGLGVMTGMMFASRVGRRFDQRKLMAAGLVVLFAAITATREERAREFAIMRAVGARASLLRQVQRAELAGVGLLAGFLASLVAQVVGWGLARYVFEFSWHGSWIVPLYGSLAGAVLALAAGWWGLRAVLNTPVMETLRKAQ